MFGSKERKRDTQTSVTGLRFPLCEMAFQLILSLNTVKLQLVYRALYELAANC